MKQLITIVLVIVAIASTNAQKLQEYTASNGVTYKVGESVALAQGSGENGNFVQ